MCLCVYVWRKFDNWWNLFEKYITPTPCHVTSHHMKYAVIFIVQKKNVTKLFWKRQINSEICCPILEQSTLMCMWIRTKGEKLKIHHSNSLKFHSKPEKSPNPIGHAHSLIQNLEYFSNQNQCLNLSYLLCLLWNKNKVLLEIRTFTHVHTYIHPVTHTKKNTHTIELAIFTVFNNIIICIHT